MTTPSTIPHPPVGGLVDAPALHFERLTERQRHGESCAWCAGNPDRRFPVRILRVVRVELYACEPCAAMYGVAAATR